MATVSLVFNRRNKLNKNKEGAIDLCVTINSIPHYIGLRISVLPKLWDNKKREVKSNHEDWFEINNILNEKVKTINKYLFECELNNQIPELTDIKQILGKKHIKHKDTFIKFCREEIGRRNDLGNATIHHQLNKLDTIQEWAGG
ncbi:MAG: Arm DNA-binding domain-containing protein, partial [Flavobacteriales bacterium]|nr:Arm DNA-binding domain-containing protein [Flavobacteriales bacterium]